MGFIDSYKHLEKLCGEILNDDRRISAYIDEMLNTPSGGFYVGTWEDDLKKLKHYRWVRNQISHEPGCSESNMCSLEDTIWLDQFYARIMNRTDPLALYHKATKPRTAVRGRTSISPPADIYAPNTTRRKQQQINPEMASAAKFAATFVIILFVIIVLFLLVNK